MFKVRDFVSFKAEYDIFPVMVVNKGMLGYIVCFLKDGEFVNKKGAKVPDYVDEGDYVAVRLVAHKEELNEWNNEVLIKMAKTSDYLEIVPKHSV